MNKRISNLTVLLLSMMLLFTGCSPRTTETQKEYGVFLGLGREDIALMEGYRMIVLDAQYFLPEDIEQLKRSGHTVLSYINLGSLEDFRPYYDRYVGYTLDAYENWEEERWMDVTVPKWQEFIGDLAGELLAKGCDGLFVDNVDVYYLYHTDAVFDAVTDMLKAMKDLGAYVSINGGDTYVQEYADRYGDLEIIDAINQETVFSAIDFDNNSFYESSETDREYFTEYIERVSALGRDVYLLEYTMDETLIGKIVDYCKEHGYTYYISKSIELTGP